MFHVFLLYGMRQILTYSGHIEQIYGVFHRNTEKKGTPLSPLDLSAPHPTSGWD